MTTPKPTAHIALIPSCSCGDGGREVDGKILCEVCKAPIAKVLCTGPMKPKETKAK